MKYDCLGCILSCPVLHTADLVGPGVLASVPGLLLHLNKSQVNTDPAVTYRLQIALCMQSYIPTRLASPEMYAAIYGDCLAGVEVNGLFNSLR